MPRRNLHAGGGVVFHVLNRSVRRDQLFFNAADYSAFERVLRDALRQVPIRLLAFCVMPNHWHLILWPEKQELPRFMHRLTLTHAKRWHAAHRSVSTGHVYQNRYQALPVQSGVHLLTVLRYVERNALRAGLVRRAEDWRWGSLWRRCNSCDDLPLAEWPILRPPNWVDVVNEPQIARELADIQRAIKNNRPIGDGNWKTEAAARFNVRLAERGRPKRNLV
jgi:putative transposase